MDSSLHPDVDVLDRPYCHLHDQPLAFDPARLLTQTRPSHLRVILIGLLADVNREIFNLHHCGYDMEAWSLPQQIPGSEEVVSVYLKPSQF